MYQTKPEFIRISDLATDRKAGKAGMLPIARATIWNNVRKGLFPKPLKLTQNVTAWRLNDIESYIANPNQNWGGRCDESIQDRQRNSSR